MDCSNHDHPSEETLERYLLRHVWGDELVGVEGHILGCEACVTRLEKIEIELNATKLALQHFTTFS